MPRPVALAEHAVEAQALLREYRRSLAPLWSAAMASGDWALMGDCQDLASALDAARRMLRRIAARSEAIACVDGIARPGHGVAA